MATDSSHDPSIPDLVSNVSRTEWFKAPTEWPPKQLAGELNSVSDTDSVSDPFDLTR